MKISAAIRAIVMILLALELNAVPALSKQNPRTSPFTTTFDAFQKLSTEPGATREQWLKVIHSFGTMAKAEKSSPTGNRSLFLAGRACLELYRRSGSTQDLDEAIGYLNDFLRRNRHGPYRILGLQELKEAHLLKRRLVPDFCGSRSNDDPALGAARPKVSDNPGSRNLPEPGQTILHQRASLGLHTEHRVPVASSSSGSSDSAGTPAVLSGTAVPESAGLYQTDPTPSATTDAARSLAAAPPRMYNCTGNPFFGKRGSPAPASPGPPLCASVPPCSIPDIGRAQSSAPAQSPTVTESKPQAPRTPDIPEDSREVSRVASNSPSPRVRMREDVTGATPGGLKLPMRGRAPQDQSKQPEALPEDAEKKPCPKGPVIVIDPGHGGKDPGAVSHDGLLKEKEVTLRIATTVRKLLEARIRNSTVALTRDSDIFLAVQERTAFANSLNADLFVSIHCNAAEDASSRGIETYYLSKASSSRAMASAARENGISPDRMSDIDATLLDLLVASKKVESVKLAESVHSSLIRAISGTAPSRRDRGVKRAPFYVLLGAKMPAILIECGFINGRETENLKKDSFLGTMAGGIAEGVVEYLQGLGSKF